MSFKGKVVYDARQHCVLIVSGNAFTPKVFVLYNYRCGVCGDGGSGSRIVVPHRSHEVRGPHFKVTCYMHGRKGLGWHGPILVLYMPIGI
jgi:hypothetical protein